MASPNYQMEMKEFILKGNFESRFTLVNIFVYSCIYSYYALKVIEFYLSKWIAITLTLLQMVQMSFWVISVIISAYYYVQIPQVQSNMTIYNLKLSAMYIPQLSCFFLFINIFKQNCKRTK